MNARRGFVPEDEQNFSADAIRKLKTASKHICYLLNEGYDLKSASTFVGNHFLLSERQRLALARTVATRAQIAERKSREIHAGDLSGKTVWIDGFNAIITLEVMYSQGIILRGMDGTIRDLASLRGTYRIIPETESAIKLMFEELQKAGIAGAEILLDEPVSNSGRLKTALAEAGSRYPVGIDIQIFRDVDRTLYDKENVISSDSVILDHCWSWFNLSDVCSERLGIKPIELASADSDNDQCNTQ